MQLPDELQIKILGELPAQDLLKATVVCWFSAHFSLSLFFINNKVQLR
jgi:hypothetical protein